MNCLTFASSDITLLKSLSWGSLGVRSSFGTREASFALKVNDVVYCT